MKITRTLIAVSVATLLLAGCAADEPAPIADPPAASETPTPTPEPTQPALADLVLSPDGLGPLAIGEAPVAADPALDVIVFDDDYCQQYVDDGRLDDAGKWIANYEPALSGTPFDPFSVLVENDIVSTVSIGSPEIVTAEGIGLGSSRADVIAAYPDAEITHGFASDAYVIDGEHGRLVVEVATEEMIGLIDESVYPVDKVGSLRVIDPSVKEIVWANTEAPSFGNCLRA
jgi:hypothetical protein